MYMSFLSYLHHGEAEKEYFIKRKITSKLKWIGPRAAGSSGEAGWGVPSTPWCLPASAPASLRPPSQSQQGLCLTPGCTLTDIRRPVKIYMLSGDRSGAARSPGQSSSSVERLKGTSLLVRAWQSVGCWRREWQATSVFLPWEPRKQ